MSHKFALQEALIHTDPKLARLLQQSDLTAPHTATTLEQTRCELSIAAFYRDGIRFGGRSK